MQEHDSDPTHPPGESPRRYRNDQKHHVDRDEARRRREASQRRKAEREPRRPRRRDWDPQLDDEDEFAARPVSARRGREEPPRPAAEPGAGDLPGLVCAVHRDAVQVRTSEGVLRARHGPAVVVGDEVHVRRLAPDRWGVVARAPRRTLLVRGDPARPGGVRELAANVDDAWIVVPVGPGRVRPGLVDRVALAVARAGVRPVVVWTKVDLLADEPGRLADLLALHGPAGYPVHGVSVVDGRGLAALRDGARGRCVVLLGHSGAGKSSLSNALDPGGARRVGDVREHDGRGRHTTSASDLRELEGGTRLIDTPGVRSFGLGPLSARDLRAEFADLVRAAGPCAFADCAHAGEAGCAVPAAAGRDAAVAHRWAAYLRIRESLE